MLKVGYDILEIGVYIPARSAPGQKSSECVFIWPHAKALNNGSSASFNKQYYMFKFLL